MCSGCVLVGGVSKNAVYRREGVWSDGSICRVGTAVVHEGKEGSGVWGGRGEGHWPADEGGQTSAWSEASAGSQAGSGGETGTKRGGVKREMGGCVGALLGTGEHGGGERAGAKRVGEGGGKLPVVALIGGRGNGSDGRKDGAWGGAAGIILWVRDGRCRWGSVGLGGAGRVVGGRAGRVSAGCRGVPDV